MLSFFGCEFSTFVFQPATKGGGRSGVGPNQDQTYRTSSGKKTAQSRQQVRFGLAVVRLLAHSIVVVGQRSHTRGHSSKPPAREKFQQQNPTTEKRKSP